MATLLDTIQGYLSPNIVSAAAAELGENKSGVSRAITGLASTILAGAISKANHEDALTGLFNTLSDRDNIGFLHNLAGLVAGGNLARNDPKDVAGAFVGSLFGDKVGGILNAINSFANLKSGSSSSLLGLAGPLVMGVLGKNIKERGLDAIGLKRLLNSESETIKRAVPAQAAGLIGIQTRDHVQTAARTATPPPAHAEPARRIGGMLWVVPALLGVGLVGSLVMRDRADDRIAEPTAPAAIEEESQFAQAKPVDGEPAPTAMSVQPVGEPVDAKLEFIRTIGDFQLRGRTDGVEAKLVEFIDSKKEPCTDAVCWFTFDRLTFKSGSAELDADASSDQLANIREILNAFPNVQLKIGGYTDNTGSDEINMTLSQRRAEAVVAAVTVLGIDPSRLVAEGYGPQHPIASNDTEGGRAQNRRIDVRVRQQ